MAIGSLGSLIQTPPDFPQNPVNGANPSVSGGRGRDTLPTNLQGGGSGQDIFTPSDSGLGGLMGGGQGMAHQMQLQIQQMQEMRLRMATPTIAQATKAADHEIANRPINNLGGKNPDATVAVLDSFKPDEKNFNHGDAVTQVVKRSGDFSEKDIQRIDDVAYMTGASMALLTRPGTEPASERLNAGILRSGLEPLKRTNVVLEDIANDPNSKIKTINQSQGANPLKTLTMMENLAFSKTEDGQTEVTPAGRHMFEGLGLEPGTDKKSRRAFTQGTLDRINEVFDGSPELKQERERNSEVSKKLADKGVNYVLSSGNEGRTLGYLQQNGFKARRDADDNLLSNPHNVVVGAIDTKDTATTSDDTMANFTSSDPETDFLADGKNIPVESNGRTKGVDGTSFSSPHVAGKLGKLQKENPNLNPSQLQNLLRNSAGDGIKGFDFPVIR